MRKALSIVMSILFFALTLTTINSIVDTKNSSAATYGEGNGFYFGTSGNTTTPGNNKNNTSVIYFGGSPWYLAGTISAGSTVNSHKYLNLLAVSSTSYPTSPSSPVNVQFCPMQGVPSENDPGGLPKAEQVCNTTDGYTTATYRYKDSTISNEMLKVFNALSEQDQNLIYSRQIGTKSNYLSQTIEAPIYALSSDEYTKIRGQNGTTDGGHSGYISDYDTEFWGRTNSGTSQSSDQYFPAVTFPATTENTFSRKNVWLTSGVRPDLTITAWVFPSLAGYKYTIADDTIVSKSQLTPSTAKGIGNPIILTAIAEDVPGQNLIGEVTSTIASYEWDLNDNNTSIVNFTATFTPYTGTNSITANRLSAGFFDDDNVLQYYTVFKSNLSGAFTQTSISASMKVPSKNEVISKNLHLKLWAEHVSEPSESSFDYITEPKEPQLTNLPDPSGSIDFINEKITNLVSPGRYAANIAGSGTTKCTNPFLVDDPDDGWFDISSSTQAISDTHWLGSIFNENYNQTNTIQVRRCSINFTEGNSANIQSLIIPSRPSAPQTINMTASAGIDYQGNPADYSRIEPVSSNMQYKTSASGTWTTLTGVSGTVKEGLAPGTYTFRRSATASSFASIPTTVTITRTTTPHDPGYGCKIGSNFDRTKTTQEQCFDAGGTEELIPNKTNIPNGYGCKIGNHFDNSIDTYEDCQDQGGRVVKKESTVKFNTNGISKKVKDKKVQNGKAIGKLPTITRNNYSFKGWWTKKTGGSKISANTKITKNVTFYARWEKTLKYKVKLQQAKCKTSFKYYVDIKKEPSVFSKIKVVSSKQKCIIVTKSKRSGRNIWDYIYFGSHKGWIYQGYRAYFKALGLKILFIK